MTGKEILLCYSNQHVGTAVTLLRSQIRTLRGRLLQWVWPNESFKSRVFFSNWLQKRKETTRLGIWSALGAESISQQTENQKMVTSILQRQGAEFANNVLRFLSLNENSAQTNTLISALWYSSREPSLAISDFWPREQWANEQVLF